MCVDSEQELDALESKLLHWIEYYNQSASNDHKQFQISNSERTNQQFLKDYYANRAPKKPNESVISIESPKVVKKPLTPPPGSVSSPSLNISLSSPTPLDTNLSFDEYKIEKEAEIRRLNEQIEATKRSSSLYISSRQQETENLKALVNTLTKERDEIMQSKEKEILELKEKLSDKEVELLEFKERDLDMFNKSEATIASLKAVSLCNWKLAHNAGKSKEAARVWGDEPAIERQTLLCDGRTHQSESKPIESGLEHTVWTSKARKHTIW